MEEGFLSKVWTMLPWILALTVALTLGMPVVHVWSTVSAATFQGAKWAATGEMDSLVKTEVASLVEQGLPIIEDQQSLFSEERDVQIFPLGSSEGEVRVTYDWPIFWPIAHLLDATGPTVPITSVETFSLVEMGHEGVTYQT